MTNRAHVLHDSVRACNVDKVRALLAAGYDVDHEDSIEMCTPLVLAAQYNNLAMMQLLVESGADIQARDYDGCSALYHASFYQHEEVMNFLLASGADVNATDKYGSTIVHVCAALGRVRALRRLIAAGADLETRDTENGDTALALAVHHRNIETVRLLVQEGDAVVTDAAMELVRDDDILDALLMAHDKRRRSINTCTLCVKVRGARSMLDILFRIFVVFTLIIPLTY